MELIDTHVHINFDAYNEDREIMMQRAFESGVTKMLHSCTQISEIDEIVGLSKKYTGEKTPDLFFGIGVHPTETADWTEESLKAIESALEDNLQANNKIRAVGETGLDYYYMKTEEARALQRKAFREQVSLAKKHKLPVIIHTRDAWEDTMTILKEEFEENRDAKAGVLHCYTGDADFALEAIKLGFYVSWSGIVTFKNSGLKEVAKQLPLDRTLVETDCPFLAPHPHRSKRNEPSFVNFTAELLADAYGISKEEIANVTTKNAEDLFQLN